LINYVFAPYLRATTTKHPKLSREIYKEIERIRTSKQCLVHGDFSPKNMLYQNNRLVILDCEVAWFGDPTFDLSFFLNHLFLKSLYHFPKETDFESMINAVRQGYSSANPEVATEIENRCAVLLPMLMLARVDGKSPVEYITDVNKKEFIRKFTNEKIKNPKNKLEAFQNSWLSELNKKWKK